MTPLLLGVVPRAHSRDLQTRCGGSGRGGGYKVTTYSAWASVTWDWFGDTRSSAALQDAAEVSSTFSAEDSYGDRVYNARAAAYLETTSPPLVAPAAPAGVTAVVSTIESGEQLVLRFQVGWTPARASRPRSSRRRSPRSKRCSARR